MTTRTLLPAAVLLIGCSLHRRPAVIEPVRGPTRDSLLALDQSRGDSVAARGRVVGALALLGQDVAFLRAGIPAVYGRDAARALLEVAPAFTGPLPTWQPLGGGVSRDLRSGYTYGVAAHLDTPKGSVQIDRYVAFWQRAPGTPWRIVAYAELNGPPAEELRFSATQFMPPARSLSGTAAETAARVRVVDSLFSDLSDRMGTAFAFTNTVAPDGAVFGGTRLVVGPKAVNELEEAQGRGTSLTWRPVYALAAASGDLGFTVGEYIATGRSPSGAAVQRFGKYLTVWQRQPDGTWKFVIQAQNATR
ncbi:MAG: YybH family protein [Gemmatimonadaceae bacterium]